MSDNTAEVKITGDASGATAAMEQAATSVDSGAGTITEALSGMASSASASAAEMAASIKEGAAASAEALETMHAGVEKVNSVFKGLAEVLIAGAIGEKIMDLGKSAAEYGEQIERASLKTGISTDSLQELRFAAGLTDVSFDSLQKALTRLSLKMAEAKDNSTPTSAAFKAIGISAGELKDMKIEDVLDAIANKFHDSSDGASKAAVAMALFGRSGADLIPFLDKGSEGIGQLKQRASDLGLVLDSTAIKSLAAANAQFKELTAITGMAGVSIGSALLPPLLQIGTAFGTALQPGGAFRDLLESLGPVIKGLLNYMSYLLEATQAFGLSWGRIATAIVDVASGKGLKSIGDNFKDLLGDVKNLHTQFSAFRDDLDKPIKPPIEAEENAQTGSGKINFNPGQSPKVQSRMAEWEMILDQDKVGYEEENNLRQMSKADEIEYWLSIINGEKTTGEEKISIRKKIADLELGMMRDTAKQRDEINQEEITATEKLGLSEIAAGEAHAKSLEQQGKLTADQLLAIELDYEQEKLQVQAKAIGDRMALLATDPTMNAAALKKLKDQLIQVEQDYTNKVTALQDSATKDDLKLWDNLTKSMVSTFGTALKGLLTGTETWQKAMASLLQGILGIFVNVGEQMVEKWAEAQLQNLIASKVTGVAAVQTNAGVAGSAAIASISAIPVIGPSLAPAAGAAAYSEAVAFTPSAAAGYDIPSGVNPLTQLHEREMVLPAGLADSVRNGSSGGGNNITVQISAVDGKSVQRLLNGNPGALATALQRGMRNYHGGAAT